MVDINSVSLKRYPEPRLNINQEKQYKFITGLGNIRYNNLAASSASSTQMSFSYLPPTKVLISRQWFLRYQLTVTLGGSVSGGATNLVNIGLEDAVRSFPLMSCCSSATATLNNQQLQLANGNQVVQTLLRFVDPKNFLENMSCAFGYQDQYANYNDYSTVGEGRSALSNYGESEVPHRGITASYDIVSNTPTSAVVKVNITEPLLISPLTWGKQEGPALPLLTTLGVNLVYDLSRVWSHATIGGSSITSISTAIDVNNGSDFNPYLQFIELTPDLSIPAVVPMEYGPRGDNVWYSYPYQQILFQSQDISGAVAAGAEQTANISVMQLSNTPQALLIYVSQRQQEQITMTSPNYFAVNSSDVAARIKSLSIALNGASNYLAEASEEQLWQISVKNGLKYDFHSWKSFAGSFLLLQLGSDIPLPQMTVPGSVSPLNIQISNLVFENQTSVSTTYSCKVVGIMDGIVEFSKGQTRAQTAVIGGQALQHIATMPLTYVDSVVYGSGFFSDLWSGLQALAPHVIKRGKELYPIAKKAIDIARPFLGVGKKKKGRSSRGGVKLSTGSSLQNNIEDYEDEEEWSS